MHLYTEVEEWQAYEGAKFVTQTSNAMPGKANWIQKGEVGSERLTPHWVHRKLTKGRDQEFPISMTPGYFHRKKNESTLNQQNFQLKIR